MTKEYRIRVLNAGREFDGFSIKSSAKNGVSIESAHIDEDRKMFQVELEIDFFHEYYDEEVTVETDDDYSIRDYEDGSYPTFEDEVIFNVQCDVSGIIKALVKFDEDGCAAEMIADSFSISELQYSTDVVSSDRKHWDNYNDDELIDRADLEHKLLTDSTVISFIDLLINDSQFELEEIEE